MGHCDRCHEPWPDEDTDSDGVLLCQSCFDAEAAEEDSYEDYREEEL